MYVVERIDYDLIRKAVNINEKQKSMLFGFVDKFVAVKAVSNGCYIVMNTLSKRRDECQTALHNYLQETSQTESYTR